MLTDRSLEVSSNQKITLEQTTRKSAMVRCFSRVRVAIETIHSTYQSVLAIKAAFRAENWTMRVSALVDRIGTEPRWLTLNANSETTSKKELAERVGVEPTDPVKGLLISSQAHSATLAPLRAQTCQPRFRA